MTSRSKGVAFEREVAAAFEAAGFAVRGLESGGDHFVIVSAGAALHVEAKRQERLRVPEWLRQQERDAPAGVRRVLVFRQSRRPMYAVEPFEQFLAREQLVEAAADRDGPPL
jgi:hypothetical protein